MIRPDDVFISVRVEPAETLRQAQPERFIVHEAGLIRAARSRRVERVLAVVNALCDEYDAHKLKTAYTPLQKFAARMHIEVGRDLDFGS